MNKIDKQIQKIKAEGRLGLMTHIVVGYPDLDRSMELIKVMADSGVDFIELQIPFSDPMADGPTIMQANKVALDNGTTPAQVMRFMGEASKQVDIPLLFMGYYNIIYNYGIEKFCLEARSKGATGLIFPDIPLDEEVNEGFLEHANKNDLYPIRLLSPASTDERIQKNSELAQGFVYYVGRKGITGSKNELDPELADNLKLVKKYIEVPIAVGFGISTPEHIQQLKTHAEIAVIGSAVLNKYSESGFDINAVSQYLKELVAAL